MSGTFVGDGHISVNKYFCPHDIYIVEIGKLIKCVHDFTTDIQIPKLDIVLFCMAFKLCDNFML